jgi:hypothetical protein
MKYTSGEVCTAKKSWQGGHFCGTLVRTSGAHKPWQVLEGSALDICFFGVSRLTIEFVQYHQKASGKIQHFGRENSNHTLARCVYF